MTKTQRQTFGVTDQDWEAAKYRVAEAMIGGRVQYHNRTKDPHGFNGRFGTIVRTVKTAREIIVKWDLDGSTYRAFAHNLTLC